MADYYGERGESLHGYLTSTASALLFWFMLNFSGFSSALTLAIIFSSILTAKIDKANLTLGLIILAALTGVLGFTKPVVLPLIPLLILAVLDELFHEWTGRLKGLLYWLVRYRFSLKFAAIGLAVIGQLPWLLVLSLIVFDFLYELAGRWLTG
jgi:thiol:disulfide interchange protein